MNKIFQFHGEIQGRKRYKQFEIIIIDVQYVIFLLLHRCPQIAPTCHYIYITPVNVSNTLGKVLTHRQ